jgi:hypothetical protein
MIKNISEYLKSSKVFFTLELSENSALYTLEIGSFPMYIQYEFGNNNNKSETIQIWSKESEDSDSDIMYNDVDSEKAFSKDEIEGIIEESLDEYKSLLRCVGEVSKKIDEAFKVAIEGRLSLGTVTAVFNDKIENY